MAKKDIIVSTWKNSTHNDLTGAGYGIRVFRQDIDRVRNWRTIYIDDEILHRGRRRFSEDCPEIRSKIIGSFLIRNGLNIWPPRLPHQLILTPLGHNIFRLRI